MRGWLELAVLTLRLPHAATIDGQKNFSTVNKKTAKFNFNGALAFRVGGGI
jgi:hypothetical protein